MAQLPVGEYLRQLDPTYGGRMEGGFSPEHPDEERRPVQVIIEYDGFDFHFTDHDNVHAGNYDRYMTASDVECQMSASA